IKVLDLTRLLPGAWCTQLLADFGADVVKIEQPGRGDYNRSFPPIAKQESGSFLLLNRNKRSLTLNLKTEAGKNIFKSLAKDADVVIESFRPGVMQRLGLDHSVLTELNPRLIMCAISGYGYGGPWEQVSGHDMNYLALAGALQLFGTKETGPIVPGLSIADVGGGSLPAAFAILAAILARQTTGRGQFIDISMTDGAVSWLSLHAADQFFAGIEPKGGERPFIGGAPCYNVYRCRDGRHIALGIIEEQFWTAFCDLIGRTDLKVQQWPTGPDADAQKAELQAVFETDDAANWVSRLVAVDVPIARVNTIEEAQSDPQLRHREMFLDVDHPDEGRIPQLGFPIKMSDTPGEIRTPPPRLGEHTDSILADLDFTPEAIAKLRADGAI
ncbi:MAG: CaiB/BaiF CoA-transferase family protein, partial [Pseudomonadota bacterium]